MAKQKHADLIHAWADGAEIQVLSGKWLDIYCPTWEADAKYRIKPQPKPDYEIDSVMTRHGLTSSYLIGKANVRFVFDGETGALKSAEVLK
jgi:hypothetical protein